MCDYPSKNPARVGLRETAGMACPPTWAPRDCVVSTDGLDALFRTQAEVPASWSTAASLAPSPDDLVECWLSATLVTDPIVKLQDARANAEARVALRRGHRG